MKRALPAVVATLSLSAAVGCGIAIKRNLSGVKPQEIIYDDLCKLQDYFDAMEAGKLKPPTLVAAHDVQRTGRAQGGGRRTYAFETPFQLQTLRRVLHENWKRVPDEVDKASSVLVRVRWSIKAGVPRVVTTEDAELTVGKKTWDLPYHPCLADLLFGDTLFRTRREMLQLPLPPPTMLPMVPVTPTPVTPPPTPVTADAGPPDTGPPSPGTQVTKP